MTILEYAGEGQFSRQEDIYHPGEGEQVVRAGDGRRGQFRGRLPDSLGLSVPAE